MTTGNRNDGRDHAMKVAFSGGMLAEAVSIAPQLRDWVLMIVQDGDIQLRFLAYKGYLLGSSAEVELLRGLLRNRSRAAVTLASSMKVGELIDAVRIDHLLLLESVSEPRK